MSDSKNRLEKMKQGIRFFLFLLVPLTIIPLLSGWVTEVSMSYIKGGSLSIAEYRMFWAGLLGMFLLVAWIVWKGRKLLPARIIEQSKSDDNPPFDRRRVVIALLSPCNNLTGCHENWSVEDKDKVKHLLPTELGLLVEKNNISKLPQWTWQQTLRAAHYHQCELEKLVLVGSREGSGTKAQLDLAYEFFSACFQGKKIEIFGKPTTHGGDYDESWQADFENLTELSELLRKILRQLQRGAPRYSDCDIIIDCTGGFKVASIAAALVTLDRPDLMFQYVGTAQNEGRLLGFNISGHEEVSA